MASTTRTRAYGPVVLLVLLALGATVVMLARGPAPVSLDVQVTDFTTALRPDGRYRPPSSTERDDVLQAVGALVVDPDADGARSALQRAGFVVAVATTENGNRYLVARSDPTAERSWALLALPLDAPPRTIVEVPHPNSDYYTEHVGLQVLAAAPDAILLEAGAHRRAAGERADVAHNDDTMFHVLAGGLSTRFDLPQLQLHGFGDRDDLDDDVVLSSGTDDPHPAIRDLAERLTDADVDVCKAWSRRCKGLEGTTNVQARAAADTGGAFAHVELSESVRRDPAEVARVLATFAR